MTRQKFARIQEWGKAFTIFGTPVYQEFLAGKRDLTCTAWAIPTYNIKGWKAPCYLMTDGHYDGYQEMLSKVVWENYGVVEGKARDPRCEHCMVHCGYDPSGALGTNYQSGDNWKNIKYNFGRGPSRFQRRRNWHNAPTTACPSARATWRRRRPSSLHPPPVRAERSQGTTARAQGAQLAEAARDTTHDLLWRGKRLQMATQARLNAWVELFISPRLASTGLTAAPARAIRRGAKSPAFGIPPGSPNRPPSCPIRACSMPPA